MPRTPLMAGNWKMNLNHVTGAGLVQKLVWSLQDRNYDPKRAECVVIPPFTVLRSIQIMIDSDRLPIKLGAQDVSAHDDGAYTGEVSADMLAKLDVAYVVVGHSERREYHHENDADVNAKARKAIAKGMTAIVCVGEGLEVRQAGGQVEYTVAQVRGSLAGIPADDLKRVVVAYEPVWAIGTGEVATPEDAQEVCAAIRSTLAELYGQNLADEVRILYGGSVKAANVKQIMAQPDVDGALVGGASLDAAEFAAIVRFYDLPDL